MAEKSWVRVQANLSLGAYEVYQATGSLPEPAGPISLSAASSRSPSRAR
jgi:hypothetical protein